MSLEAYRELVDVCAARRLNYSIANGSPYHARILIKKLFEIATSEVVLVTGALTDATKDSIDIYGHDPVIECANQFLRDPSTCLNIVVQKGRVHREQENRFLAKVINDKQRNGLVTITIPPNENTLSALPHFMVSDGSAYRMETAADAEPNVVEMKAVANFGDKSTANKLRNLFSNIDEFLKASGKLSRQEFVPGASY
jgi:hypothetical protein